MHFSDTWYFANEEIRVPLRKGHCTLGISFLETKDDELVLITTGPAFYIVAGEVNSFLGRFHCRYGDSGFVWRVIPPRSIEFAGCTPLGLPATVTNVGSLP